MRASFNFVSCLWFEVRRIGERYGSGVDRPAGCGVCELFRYAVRKSYKSLINRLMQIRDDAFY